MTEVGKYVQKVYHNTIQLVDQYFHCVTYPLSLLMKGYMYFFIFVIFLFWKGIDILISNILLNLCYIKFTHIESFYKSIWNLIFCMWGNQFFCTMLQLHWLYGSILRRLVFRLILRTLSLVNSRIYTFYFVKS